MEQILDGLAFAFGFVQRYFIDILFFMLVPAGLVMGVVAYHGRRYSRRRALKLGWDLTLGAVLLSTFCYVTFGRPVWVAWFMEPIRAWLNGT